MYHIPNSSGVVCTHSGCRVEDQLRAIHGKSLPIHGVVPTVANVNGDAAVGSFEDRVPCVALHVVRRLVEVAHARDMVLCSKAIRVVTTTMLYVRDTSIALRVVPTHCRCSSGMELKG
jgi:hypothetical protein